MRVPRPRAPRPARPGARYLHGRRRCPGSGSGSPRAPRTGAAQQVAAASRRPSPTRTGTSSRGGARVPGALPTRAARSPRSAPRGWMRSLARQPRAFPRPQPLPGVGPGLAGTRGMAPGSGSGPYPAPGTLPTRPHGGAVGLRAALTSAAPVHLSPRRVGRARPVLAPPRAPTPPPVQGLPSRRGSPGNFAGHRVGGLRICLAKPAPAGGARGSGRQEGKRASE